MEHHSILSVMLVVSIAFLVPIFLQHFRLSFVPVVIAEIIAGLFIGQSGFNIVSEDIWLEMLSLLGFIFLMFISGLEIDFDAFDVKKTDKKNGEKKLPNPFLLALAIFVIILITAFVLSNILVGFHLIKDPYLMTLIISTISLGIVVPVLKEKNLLQNELGQTILLVTVISDVSTMVLLTVYAMLQAEKGMQISFLLILFLGVFVAYRFIKRFFKVEVFDRLLGGTVQLGTRGVFTLILFFVALSETLGAENILGAFLAGVIVSLLSPKKEFVQQLDSFGFGFFIPIFFVMVGVKLDVPKLFSNPDILLLMPILLIFMYIAKIVPALIMKKWYSWREVFSLGVLTTSKLSLVIAASAIALQLGVITDEFNGALILVSILTCLISPIVFTKIFPKQEKTQESVCIVGANSSSLAVSLDLMKEGYLVRVISKEENKKTQLLNEYHEFPMTYVEDFTTELLEKEEAFDSDKIVFSTSEDVQNIQLAKYAKAKGVKNIIVRVESPELHEQVSKEGLTIYSMLYSTRTLLKALINNPGVVDFISHHNESIREVFMNNGKYDGISLKKIPFLGDSLILVVNRNGHYIIPHGDTQLKIGDKLLVSGSRESLSALRQELEISMYSPFL